MQKVDWLVTNTITHTRRRSLVHIQGWHGNTLCGVPIPMFAYDATYQPAELTCYRCKRSAERQEGDSYSVRPRPVRTVETTDNHQGSQVGHEEVLLVRPDGDVFP